MILPEFNYPYQDFGPLHTKPKRIWVEIMFPYTFEQIRQFCVPEPHKQELHCKKSKFRNRKLKLKYTYS